MLKILVNRSDKNLLTATFIVPYYVFFNSKLQTEGKDGKVVGAC